MATVQEIVSDPRFAKATGEQKQRLIAKAQDAPASLRQVVEESAKRALSEASFRPGSISRDLATDPVTQAKALPPVAGAAGALTGIPMGASLGVVGGRQISNAALRSYGRPEEVPSGVEQALEAAGSVAADIVPIPALNRRIFGKQVGQAERLAKVPEFPESLRPPTGPGSTTKWIDEMGKAIATGEIGAEPVVLKQIQDQINFIYKNRKNVPLSDMVEGKLKYLNQWVQHSLGKAIPGRGEASRSLARSQAVPRAIGNTYKALPKTVRAGLETYGIPALGGAALLRALGSREK